MNYRPYEFSDTGDNREAMVENVLSDAFEVIAEEKAAETGISKPRAALDVPIYIEECVQPARRVFTAEEARQLGPANLAAFKATGIIVDHDSIQFLLPEQVTAWEKAVNKYLRNNPIETS